MNKKGFVLIETIVVLLVVVVCMLGLYKAYSFVFEDAKQNKYYDDINDIYKINILKRTFIEGYPTIDSGYVKFEPSECAQYGMSEDCTSLLTEFKVRDVIYTTMNISEILDSHVSTNIDVLSNTDIEYMKHLEDNHRYLIIRSSKDGYNYYASLSLGATL